MIYGGQQGQKKNQELKWCKLRHKRKKKSPNHMQKYGCGVNEKKDGLSLGAPQTQTR